MNSSILRKQIYQTQQQIENELKFLKGRSFLIKGIVYKLCRKCGTPGCRCERGDLHQSWVLAVPEKGRKRMRMVPKGKRVQWLQLANRYRHFRKSRAHLVKLFGQLLRLVDKLEAERTIPPPEK